MIATATRKVDVLDADGNKLRQIHVKAGHRYTTDHPDGAWMAEHHPDLFDLGTGDPVEAGNTPPSQPDSEE